MTSSNIQAEIEKRIKYWQHAGEDGHIVNAASIAGELVKVLTLIKVRNKELARRLKYSKEIFFRKEWFKDSEAFNILNSTIAELEGKS